MYYVCSSLISFYSCCPPCFFFILLFSYSYCFSAAFSLEYLYFCFPILLLLSLFNLSVLVHTLSSRSQIQVVSSCVLSCVLGLLWMTFRWNHIGGVCFGSLLLLWCFGSIVLCSCFVVYCVCQSTLCPTDKAVIDVGIIETSFKKWLIRWRRFCSSKKQRKHVVNNMVFELFCQLLITSSSTQEMLILLVMLLCQSLSCPLKYAILIYKLTKNSLFYRHSAVWPTATLCPTPPELYCCSLDGCQRCSDV